MNALELLKADHEVVAELFEQVKATDETEHPALFERIKTELDVHAHIEETIFYPQMEADGDEELGDIVREGIEEHRQIKMFLDELASLSEDSEKFEPKLKVLIEDVEHHVEEEEGEMFSLIEDQFDEETLDEIGSALEAEKRSFKKELSAAASS
jgi:hemerythrin-like domain-containing protein